MKCATDLVEQIDSRLAASTHLVLLRAIENVGTCTYAAHYPRYRDLNAIYFASRWKPIPRLRSDIRADINNARRAMYQQPCLVCEWCQRRKRLWSERT